MKKLPPKKKNQLIMRMITLANLQLETFDELGIDEEAPMRNENKKLISYLEDVVDSSFQNKAARSTTKLTDLIKKIDTVIRKNDD